ncbi:MAG TPA: aminoglycoside phosphotransferase family protein [Candidatus Angelobacter sp.]|nr:aminoglycoside phosphotransferase family protein [Candidatus Angelobacter sp.]
MELSRDTLTQIILRGLHLPLDEPVTIVDVSRHSNFNYVYRALVGIVSVFLKIVPEKPRKFDVRLPRERIAGEAEALRRFRCFSGETVLVPEVLFLDAEHYALGMSDVGRGRTALFDVILKKYPLFSEQAHNLGQALGLVHRSTKGCEPWRPAEENRLIQSVIFDGLLSPGVREICPEAWKDSIAEMRYRADCLVHADLWSKNLLVGGGKPIAIVDFEGAFVGDPAFDVGTVVAVALLPAMENPVLMSCSLDAIYCFISSYESAARDSKWSRAVTSRALKFTGVFLAARGFGPFAYQMTSEARRRTGHLARELLLSPPGDCADLADRVQGIFRPNASSQQLQRSQNHAH